jgi:hypothetical protein
MGSLFKVWRTNTPEAGAQDKGCCWDQEVKVVRVEGLVQDQEGEAEMVPEIGIEPTTFALRVRCSTD